MSYDSRVITIPTDSLSGYVHRDSRSATTTILINLTGFISASPNIFPLGSGTAIVTYYTNRCWHYSNAAFIRWVTSVAPDSSGLNYPGPGIFGVDTTSPAVVESIKEA